MELGTTQMHESSDLLATTESRSHTSSSGGARVGLLARLQSPMSCRDQLHLAWHVLMLVAIAAVTIYLIAKWRRRHSAKGKAMPGPRGWPLLGNASSLDHKYPHVTMTNWAKEFGDVYELKLMGEKVVVANGKDDIRDVLIHHSDDFAGRKQTFRLLAITRGGTDIMAGSLTDEWKRLKTCTMRAMKLHGDGLTAIETVCHDILADFIADIQHTGSTPFDPLDKIIRALANVMATVVIGKKFALDDPDPLAIYSSSDKAIRSFINPNGFYLDLFPWLRHILPGTIYKELREGVNERDALLDKHFTPMIATWEAGKCRGVLDTMYDYHLHEKTPDGRPIISMEQVFAACMDLMMAGVISTSSVLQCFVLLLLHHPEVKAKIEAEIKDVVGDERLPSLADKAAMPYLQATLLEVMRYVTVGPLSVPHYTTTDTTLKGYHIPKGTQVLTNFWALFHDERLWEDPWTFRPERFLDDHGHLLHPDHPRRQCLLPFGAGRRVCAGEMLAKNRSFLFAASLVQRFDFRSPPGTPLPSCDPRTFVYEAAYHPLPFKIVAQPRTTAARKSSSLDGV